MRLNLVPMVGVLALALGAVSAANADVCTSVCGTVKVTCGAAAVTAFRSCRHDARGAASRDARRQAMATCRDQAMTAKEECHGRIRDCRSTCHSLPPGECIRSCVLDIRACIAKAVADGRACRGACSSADGFRCRASCAQAASVAIHECGVAFGACTGPCVGSPAGAFVD
jgi:hypothetical protein